MSSFSAAMRWRMRRRSVSSLVSPGPRVPMPPPSRDSASLDPASRGSRYCSCASSTCSCPSCVRARRAKMSRISSVRSMTRRPQTFSRLRACAGVRSLSTITMLDVRLVARERQRVGLAAADERRRIRRGFVLRHAEHDLGAGRARQPGQFVQRMFGIDRARGARDQLTSAARSCGRSFVAVRRALIPEAILARGSRRPRLRGRADRGAARVDDRRRLATRTRPASITNKRGSSASAPRSAGTIGPQARRCGSRSSPSPVPASRRQRPRDRMRRHAHRHRSRSCAATPGAIASGASRMSDNGPGQNVSARRALAGLSRPPSASTCSREAAMSGTPVSLGLPLRSNSVRTAACESGLTASP